MRGFFNPTTKELHIVRGSRQKPPEGFEVVEVTSITGDAATHYTFDPKTGIASPHPGSKQEHAIRAKLESLSKKAQFELLQSSGVTLTEAEAAELGKMIIEEDDKAKKSK